MPVFHPGDPGTHERLPTDEVLAVLEPAERDALLKHRDLLDDHRALMRAMPSMPERERFAASEFITRMHKPSPPTPAAHEIERWREQGYRDTARAPRGSAPLATINQAQMRAQDGVTNGVGLRSTYQSPPELVDSASLPYAADEYVMPDSKNHTLSGTDSATRLYPRSTFGGALLMDYGLP